MSFKVISGIGSSPELVEALSAADAELVRAPIWTEDDLIANAQDADAVMVGAAERYTRRAIQALTKCKVISRMGVGYDNIDVPAATEKGIAVACVPDASVIEVSDHAVALLLALSRKLLPIDRLVREGAWQLGKWDIFNKRVPMFRLSEQTIGVVGAGRIGGAFARKARVFCKRLIVCDPYLSAAVAKEMGAELVDFESLLRDSDYISLHPPHTDETRHMFGLAQFKQMKPTAYIVNTGRGELIDEKALYTALTEAYIAGAGLDVTDPEPPKPDNPLFKLDNVIITAHSAFYTEDSMRDLRQRTVQAVVTALRGEWPTFIANPEVRERGNRRIQ